MTKTWIYGVTTGDDLEVPRRDYTNFPRYNGGSQYWRYDSVSTTHLFLLNGYTHLTMLYLILNYRNQRIILDRPVKPWVGPYNPHSPIHLFPISGINSILAPFNGRVSLLEALYNFQGLVDKG